jgi:23S rRNA (guanosine2251-2'-O)-methyltransferase
MIKKTSQQGELIFGIHPIVELLKAKKRKLITLYTTRPEPKAWSQIARLLPQKPVVPIQYVPRDVLHKIAGTTDHQGVVAYAQPFVIRKKFFDPVKQPLLIMLDGVQDVHNLGAILRSTYCTGFDGVIICQKQAAPITATVLKSAAGLAEHMDIYIAPSPSAAVQELKKAGYNLYLTFFDGVNAAACDYTSPLCIVIGGEGFGISKEIANAGKHITLPQKTTDISYNASVAAGIVLFLVASKVGVLAK